MDMKERKILEWPYEGEENPWTMCMHKKNGVAGDDMNEGELDDVNGMKETM